LVCLTGNSMRSRIAGGVHGFTDPGPTP
jgi:hypothetical protein